MSEPILFDPGNRLLGVSAGDFSLYGGQGSSGFALHEARDGLAPAPVTPTANAPAAGANAHDGAALRVAEAPAQIDIAAELPSSGWAAASTSFLLAPAIPPFHAAEIDSGRAPDAPVLSGWAPDAPGAGAPAFFAAPATASGDPVADGLTAIVPTEAFHAPGALAPLAETVTGAVSLTLGALDDTLGDLAGSDPLGGVATLVSLVSVSDLFDLHPVDAPLPDAPADLGLGMLDSLAGDALLPDALLGAGDHHDGGGAIGDALDHTLGL